MRCPGCGYEPRDRLLHSPCPGGCGTIWWDTESYVSELAKNLEIHSVLDIGCGLKGVIAQAYWEERGIAAGFACDKHVIKALPPLWTPLLFDARNLLEHDIYVDFTTHCGLLEHVPYKEAFELLHVVELVTNRRVFSTCSAVLREVDWKSRKDGNPFHKYRSWWDARTFEILGYKVDRKRMKDQTTFVEEVTYTFDPENLESWGERSTAAKLHMAQRACSIENCKAPPIVWDARQDGNVYFCLEHHLKHGPVHPEPVDAWLKVPNWENKIERPPVEWMAKLC